MRPSIDDLRNAVDVFAGALEAADPGAEVPSCPGWTVGDLVHHVGWVHEWARAAIVERRNTSPELPELVPPADLGSWYRARAHRLVEAIAADPTAPAWIFGEGEGSVTWWLRRQVHEVVLHTWDLAACQDGDVEMDPELAWDAVQEAAEVFYPRQVRLGRIEPLPGTLVLVPTDRPQASVRIGTGPEHHVRGSAADLMLLVWQRRRLDGDPVTAELLSRPLTP